MIEFFLGYTILLLFTSTYSYLKHATLVHKKENYVRLTDKQKVIFNSLYYATMVAVISLNVVSIILIINVVFPAV